MNKKINMKPIDISKSSFEVRDSTKKGYFSIYDDSKELKTPGGKTLTSKNNRLLSLIADELNTKKTLDPSEFSFYSIYSIESDLLDEIFPNIISNLEDMILGDVVLKSCAGPEILEQMKKWKHLNEFLDSENIKHPNYIQVFDVKDIKEWVYDLGEDFSKNHEKLVKTMESHISQLSNMEKSAFIALYNMSNSIMYSYLLVKSLCNPSEFSHAIFSGHAVHPKMYEDELDENKNMIDGLLFYANAIQNYLNIGIVKTEKETWNELNKLRTQNVVLDDLGGIADKISGNIDYEVLVEHLLAYSYRSVEMTPTPISKMIFNIGNSYKPKSIADLCCGIGNISRFFVYSDVDAYDINSGCIKLAKKLLPNVNFYNQCIIKSEIKKSYDMVVTHIPFGFRMDIDGSKKPFEILALNKSLSILNDGGRLLCLVPQSFLFNNIFKETRKEIVENHSLDQIVEIPANTLTHTQIGSALVIITKNGNTKSCKSRLYQKERSDLLKRKNISKKSLLNTWVYPQEVKSKIKVDEFLKKNNLKSEKIKLGDFSTIVNGYQPKSDEKKNKGEFLFLTGKNINDGNLVSNEKDIYLDGVRNNNMMKCILKPGDIIISTLFKDRKIYQFKDDDPKSIASNNIKIIRSEDNEYLMKYLSTQSFNEQFLEQCKIKLKGAVIPYLTSSDLAEIEIYKIPLDNLISSIELSSTSDLSRDALLKTITKNIKDKTISDYVNEILISHFEDPIIKLSKNQESKNLEFKSTLRTDLLKRGIDGKKLEYEVLLTIGAFSNTNGGDLLIGVSDDNNIIGIEVDKFKNTDKFILHLRNIISTRIKPNVLNIPGLIDISTVEKDGKTVCRIKVKESDEDIFVYLNKGSEGEYYVRQGPASQKLSPREAMKYSKKKFSKT